MAAKPDDVELEDVVEAAPVEPEPTQPSAPEAGPVPGADPDPEAEVAEYLARQAAEYGKYRAIGPIYHDGALAYAAGHPVPISNVVQYGYLDNGLVEEVPSEEKD